MAITNKDVDKLKEAFATKEDLNRFATKEDLNRFATKEDMDARFKEVQSVLNKQAAAILNQTNKLLEHDGKFDEMNEKIDRKFDLVLTGQDKIIKELEKAREDRTLAIGKDKEQDRRIESLEGKVQKIEDKVMV